MRRTRRLARAVAASVAMLVSAGCGPHAALQLTMHPESLTVPRVLTPAVTLVPPAPITVPLPVPPIPVLPPPPIAPYVPPPVVKAPACPKASEFATPAEAATVDVTSAPAPATYVQSSRGTYSGSAATPSAGKLTSSVVSTITAAPQTTAPTGQVSDNWLVTRVDTASHATTLEAYQLATPSGSGQLVTPGIYLTGLKWKDPIRGDLSFVPVGTGIEIMPSPVNTSTTGVFASSATDPISLTTMTATGNVLGRKRIDVCGTLLDTWTVQLTGTITSPTARYQFAWRQQIATQYGGVDVEDDLTLTTPVSGLDWDRTLHDTNTPEVKK